MSWRSRRALGVPWVVGSYYFQTGEHTFCARKRLPCPGCGKQLERHRTFRDENHYGFDGSADALEDEMYAWMDIPALCTPCGGPGRRRAVAQIPVAVTGNVSRSTVTGRSGEPQ